MKSAKKSSVKKAKPTKAAPKRAKAKGGKAPVKARIKRQRIGIFGGSFDPFHQGHLNSLLTVLRQQKLDKILVLPAMQSPLRQLIQGSDPQHRLNMVSSGIAGHSKLVVDARELERGGVSYTIDTIKELKREHSKHSLFLIIGMDQMGKFDMWRDYTTILGEVDIVATSRPGYDIPRELSDFPTGIQPFIRKFSSKKVELTTGKSIYFVQLEDVEISASEVRKRVREGADVESIIPSPVAEYISEHNLYENVSKSIGDFERFTQQCAEWLKSKGGINVQGYDLRSANGLTEFTLIASGTSTRHTTALAEFISREVKKELGVWPQGVEGLSEGRWVVLDYGSLIVHLFYDYVRQEYRLENLWSNSGKEMAKVNP